MHEAEFWVGVAFVIFMAIAWKMGAFKSLLSGLDSRAKRIRAELDEARRLREEAAAVLADYQRRRGEAEREAEDLVASAREEAERIAREAHERMADFVTRRTAAAEAKIAQAEVQAQQQVRAAAADAAVRISEEVLREEMRAGAGQDLITSSLGEIRGKLNA
ncbi:MAG TPA: ATP F0F1 synthase subunit B [Enterovirga sp.]